MNVIYTQLLDDNQMDQILLNLPYRISLASTHINTISKLNCLNLFNRSQDKRKFVMAMQNVLPILHYIIKTTTIPSYLQNIYDSCPTQAGKSLIILLDNPAFIVTEAHYIHLLKRHSQYIIIPKRGNPSCPIWDALENYTSTKDTYTCNISKYFPDKISPEGVNELGILSYKFGFYDTFVKCVELGFDVKLEDIIMAINLNSATSSYISSISSVYYSQQNVINKQRQQVIYENMVKIMLYTINNLKYIFKFSDLKITNMRAQVIDSSICEYVENLIKYCSGDDTERENLIKDCYKNGVPIKILVTEQDNSTQVNNLYYYLYDYLVSDCKKLTMPLSSKNEDYKKISNMLNDYLKNPQIMFREMFKYFTITQISSYYKINKDKVYCDNYCINNAYMFRNNKLIKYIESKDKGITPGLMYVLYVKTKVKYDTDYTQKYIKSKFIDDTITLLETRVDDLIVVK
jgi:hypothetical protein